MFSDFLESTVDIPYRRNTTHNSLPIYLNYILEYAMSSWVCGANIKGDKLILRIIIIENRLIRSYLAYKIAHII